MVPRESQVAARPIPETRELRDAWALAAGAGIGWFWAFALLATRDYLILLYSVLSPTPPVWGFLALPAWKLVAALGAAALLTGAAAWLVRLSKRDCIQPVCALYLAYLVPLLDLVRGAGVPLPPTFYEPLLLAVITGYTARAVAREMGLRFPLSSPPARSWLILTWVCAASAAVWWYLQGASAYEDFLLGYHDFGHFGYRVVNTWQGRGFLLESPGEPAFWDHFNPGLALLAPLWGLWPDEKLFILLQALCLAVPAVLVHGIARAWGAQPQAAACWALAYLAFPAVGLLNLNYSYGWHPVSMALPLIFLAVWALLHRRYVAAVAATVLACSFKETVLVTLGCLAAALAVQAWLDQSRSKVDSVARRPDALLARRVPWSVWLLVWAAITVAFFLVVRLTPFAQFQTSRFANLGDSSLEIALSPVLRPAAFWGQVAQPRSLIFLLALLVPLGLRALVRGWLILLAAVLPLTVLLAWEHQPATCIAFQYVTTLIPVFFLAAISGAARDAHGAQRPGDALSLEGASVSIQQGLLTVGAAALAACLTASALFGGLPWSSRTLVVMAARSYQVDGQHSAQNPRAAGSPGHRRLMTVIHKVNHPERAVLASGRVAAHLLHVRRLEAVGQAIVRWDDLCVEAGPGRSGVEVFDWILLDTCEVFQQSPEDMDFIIQQARRAGYAEMHAGDGILLFARRSPPEVSGVLQSDLPE
jgi:uncharacterized membrane protein